MRREKKRVNYYPFGLEHKGYNNTINGTDHPYGFGGKEEQNELGLGWLDITARNYNPAIGRWMNLDPLAEDMRRHSPYNYAFNNPIYFMDPDGMAPVGCPSCETEEDWNAYYSQGYNTAAQLGVLGTASDGENTFNWVKQNDILTTGHNEEGRTLFYIKGKLQDLDRHTSRLDALSSLVADALMPESPGKLFKFFGKFFKGGGDEAAEAVGNVTDDVVYRGDTRSPETIFQEGFSPQGNQMDLFDHAAGYSVDNSGYVATSISENSAQRFAGADGYVYTIDNPSNGIDVNKALGSKSPHPSEAEIAVPGKIHPSNIQSAKKVGSSEVIKNN